MVTEAAVAAINVGRTEPYSTDNGHYTRSNGVSLGTSTLVPSEVPGDELVGVNKTVAQSRLYRRRHMGLGAADTVRNKWVTIDANARV